MKISTLVGTRWTYGVALALGLATGPRAWGQVAPGTLDPTFGTNGQVYLNFTSPVTTPDEAKAVVLLPDGKLVVAGQENGGVEVARFNSDGSLDRTFGNNGRVLYDFGSSTYGGVTSTLPSRVKEMKLLADGKLLLLGRAGTAAFMARLLPTGALDTAYGTNGVVKVMPGSRGAIAYDAALGPDGKLELFSTVVQLSRYAAMVSFFQADGAMEKNTYLNFPPEYTSAYCTSGVVAPDGKVLAGGYSWGSRTVKSANGWATLAGSAASVAQLLADGTLDTSFGTGGYASLPTELVVGKDTTYLSTSCQKIALQPDGKILLVGSVEATKDANKPYMDFPSGLVARFNANGTLDTSFGGGKGYVAIDFSTGDKQQHNLNSVLVQSDGKIIAAGYRASVESAGSSASFALARLTADGQLDTSFGTAGKVVLAPQRQSILHDMVLQPDNKLVVVGTVATEGAKTGLWRVENDENYDGNPKNGQFALLRFNGNTTLAAKTALPAELADLYPNPVTDLVTVRLSAAVVREAATLEVLDPLGRLVRQQPLAPGQTTTQLPVATLAKGLYTVCVRTPQGVLTKRLAVN